MDGRIEPVAEIEADVRAAEWRSFLFLTVVMVPVLTVRENIVLPIQLDGGKVDERYVGEVVTA